jgi:hypothetical protein
VASAGLNHWRSQYNNDWCTSLTATMHEVGHQIGLLHSNKNFQKYEDRTGYMARGYRNPNWPQRCFNGQNNDHLGWYDNKKYTFDPISDGSKVFNLATFVDYQTTNDPVLINVGDELYLQYNRAKGFNADTGEMQDTVTVTTKPLDGGSQLMAGLSVDQETTYAYANYKGSGRSVYIKACQRLDNSAKGDAMKISVGLDQPASCSGAVTGLPNVNGNGVNSSGNSQPAVSATTNNQPTLPIPINNQPATTSSNTSTNTNHASSSASAPAPAGGRIPSGTSISDWLANNGFTTNKGGSGATVPPPASTPAPPPPVVQPAPTPAPPAPTGSQVFSSSNTNVYSWLQNWLARRRNP